MEHIKKILLAMLSSILVMTLAVCAFYFFNWIAESFSGIVSGILAIFLFLTLIFSIAFYSE